MKKLLRVLVPVLMIALIIASIGWYLFVYDRNFTIDVLLGQARYQNLHGNSRISSWFYDLAYEFSGRDENVAIELAEKYKSGGNYTRAEVTLTKALATAPTADLYIALSKTYVEQDKLLDAEALLEGIGDPTIRATIETLRPAAPTVDYEAGFYSKYISVSLSSASGEIYYTANGDYPSVADAPYDSPIALQAGETTIRAICVDGNGLVSPMTVCTYTINGVIEPAVFIDTAMDTAVRELLGISSDKIIYTNELWEITEFTVPEGVTDLTDLGLMPYLTELTASGLELGSLDGLTGLTKLQKLDLSDSRFPADCLSVVASLPALEELNISDCALSTVSGLENASKLKILKAENNTIRNLDPLSALISLTELDMNHNALTALDSVSGLTELETLDVSYNSLTSLAPIHGFTKLTSLNAAGNQIADLTGVSELTALKSLALDYNALTDIDALGACTGLTELLISNNAITDMSALAALTNLETFDFSYNQAVSLPDWPSTAKLRTVNGSHNSLTDIDELAGMQDLTYVNMDYNAITDVDKLENCTNLVQVNVYGNEIEDVSALTQHNIIVNYDPT